MVRVHVDATFLPMPEHGLFPMPFYVWRMPWEKFEEFACAPPKGYKAWGVWIIIALVTSSHRSHGQHTEATYCYSVSDTHKGALEFFFSNSDSF